VNCEGGFSQDKATPFTIFVTATTKIVKGVCGGGGGEVGIGEALRLNRRSFSWWREQKLEWKIGGFFVTGEPYLWLAGFYQEESRAKPLRREGRLDFMVNSLD